MQALLKAEPAILKVLVEAFRVIVVSEFVKGNSWPELVPDLRSVIENSNLINSGPDSEWKTINALTVLHALLRPFQYFLNPKVATGASITAARVDCKRNSCTSAICIPSSC
ncbi:hypothetical protein L1049_017073 [Liquidambar formosana]|uniref:Uncharacterized protein n=1 Tax=Liquidambar formosana TaxID=63359 RepID=A0AAP0S2M1_LIQFO